MRNARKRRLVRSGKRPQAQKRKYKTIKVKGDPVPAAGNQPFSK